MASSVLQRALFGTSARQFECVISTGVLRSFNGIERGAIRTVRNIHRHPHRVHAIQNLCAIIAQAGIGGIRRSAADAVVAVGKLRDALAQAVEIIHIFHGAEVHGVLLPDHDPDLARFLRGFKIRRAIHAHKIVRTRVDQRIPAGDVPQRAFEYVALGVSDGRMENRDPGIFQLLEIGRLKAGRMRLPGG